jgi:predicted nucleotide-binding protein
VRFIADFFVPLTESEADIILADVASDKVTVSGWDRRSASDRQVEMVKLLSNESDEVLEVLMEFLSPPNQAARTAEDSATDSNQPEAMSAAPSEGPIFVVHGRARAALHEAVRALERGTNREVIVLHEQPNAGRTILEKFEDHADRASFAVVLLTADDEGGTRSDNDVNLRGRQNVIFELGFFFGRLGRKRVAVLLENGIEKPSDIDGLVYITFDEHGAWKQILARELEASGISVSRSRLP